MRSLSKYTSRTLTTSLLITVLVACAAVTSSAQSTPTKFVTSGEDVFDFVDCGYGTLTAHFTYSGFAICRVDNEGTRRCVGHLVTDAVVTNPLNGKIATGNWILNTQESSASVVNAGVFLDLNVSGVGKVAHLSGRNIFDRTTLTFVFGTPSLDKSFVPALCSALQ